MRKPTAFEMVLMGGGVVFILIFLYVISHPNRSVCDKSPVSSACLQETNSDNGMYNQYQQNGNH